MSRRSRLMAAFGLALALVLGAAVGAVLLVRSAWFHEKVRQRIVAEAERITGGRVQLGSFRFDWARLEARLEEFQLRGMEPADRPPLFRARSITIGFRVDSFLRRDFNVALLAIEAPQVSLEMDEHGRINLPRLALASEGDPLEPFLKLAIRRLEFRQGDFSLLARRLPLDFSAHNFRLGAIYEAGRARYLGTLRMDRFQMGAPVSLPVTIDSELAWILEGNRLEIGRARLRSGSSAVEVAGGIRSFQPFQADFDCAGTASITELAGPLGLPVLAAGSADFNVHVALAPNDFSVQGTAEASGLTLTRDGLRLEDMTARATFEATPGRLHAHRLVVGALGGSFQGEAMLETDRAFEVRGSFSSLPLERLAARLRPAEPPWTGLVSGDISLRGALVGPAPRDLRARVKLAVEPAGDRPLRGTVEAVYQQRGNVVRFGESFLATESTRLEFSGLLGGKMRLALATRSLEELRQAASWFSEQTPASLPLRLAGGELRLSGHLVGPLEDLHFEGNLTAGPLEYEGRPIDRLAAEFELEPEALRLRNLTLRRDRARLEGDVSVGLVGWRPVRQSRLAGNLTITGLSLEQLWQEAALKLPALGTLSAAAKFHGTVAEPHLLARLHVSGLAVYGEQLDALDAEVRYGAAGLEILDGRVSGAAGAARFTGTYRPQGDDWRRGALTFHTQGAGFRLSRIEAVRRLRQGLDGTAGWRADGAVEVGPRPRLTALLGEAYLRELSLEKRPLGDARIQARSRDEVLEVRGEGTLQAARLTARAEWSLVGESFGLGEVRFRGLSLGALAEVGLFGERGHQLPVEAVLDGEVAFTGPVLRPAAWRGMARVSRFELVPTARVDPAKRGDLTLRNTGPLIFAIHPGGIAIERARLVSTNTDLSAAGTLSFPRRSPWNLQVEGWLDLAVLGSFEPELLAEGRSQISVTVRGSLLEPQLFGRLRFENASFFLKGFPNGLEQVTGSILFDRNRATIEQLRAQTGGGELELAGFLAFGGEELIYRLQAQARRVRLRYPAEVSTVLDARLEFTGSSTRSLLSGEVTLQRATFLAGSDIGGILSETARPATRPAVTSPFLRGMAFDVAIVTSGEAEFATSLTRDIVLEANLRLRGGPARPVLLGRVAVNQGEIIFFGNRYTISQGEITFFNPAKIEPVLALDLETKVRGYTVMINFSGPLDQLNFTYRSDPPLQSQEILALLTVGRTPETTRAPGGQAATSQSFLQAGGNSLLGQALVTPVSSRLQRFFGVSRIKIDPQLTGVDNTPETYITIEQQVSREITLTYVTNLARTQQQIVRIEWNLSRDWSVNAVRDSNGVFGIDFVYRRRF